MKIETSLGIRDIGEPNEEGVFYDHYFDVPEEYFNHLCSMVDKVYINPDNPEWIIVEFNDAYYSAEYKLIK